MRSIATILPYIQIALSLILIAFVLLQQSDADLGSTFGGSDSGSASRTRRGAERTMFNATIVVGILFAVTAILALIIK
jgi:preprotein translocase subunit SecG